MSDRSWVHEAIARIEADFARSADTHLIRVELPGHPGIDLYLKDKSTHPTGSLKHRLARSLFLYGLCNGWIGPGTTVVESSSGSTAVSEAYFARLLGLPFLAVMPATTSPDKIAKIEFQGGRCHFVADPREVYAASRKLAAETGGHYLDQFTFAERATDWRGNNNIANRSSTRCGWKHTPSPPGWCAVPAPAGPRPRSGATSATSGWARGCAWSTRSTRCSTATGPPQRDPVEGPSSCIEGIGRPRVEASFNPDLVDRMIAVPDAASLAAMRVLASGWAGAAAARPAPICGAARC